jgi:hypothetical protein
LFATLPAISQSAMSTAARPWMKAPLRPKTWNFFCRSSDGLPSCVASRPIHSGARMESMATLTAGMAVKPNVSPQPTTPVSSSAPSCPSLLASSTRPRPTCLPRRYQSSRHRRIQRQHLVFLRLFPEQILHLLELGARPLHDTGNHRAVER